MTRLTRGLALAALVLACCGALGGLKAQDQSAPAERGVRRVVLRVLTTVDFPPFNYQDEDGQLTGFNVDLARGLCQELNLQCSVEARAWEDLLPAVMRREADAVVAGHVVTAKALAQVDFSDRYFHTPGRFAARRGSDLDISPQGLDGHTIGVAKGTPHAAYLDAFFRDSTIVPFDSPELAREALMAGKVETLFDDGISMMMWVGGTLSKDCCEMTGGPYLEPKYFGEGLAIAVPKGDRELRGQINQALRRLRASGRFDELVSRYFPERVY
jgi:polar amino acid transport system substrate-binding protein